MKCAFAVLLLAGCALRTPIAPVAACQIVRDSRSLVVDAGPKDLYELSWGTPAHRAARSAYAQLITSYTLSGVGAAALVAGLVTAFATDSATHPEVRDAGYGLAAGAIALGAVAIVLSYTLPRSVRHAREQLVSYGEHCQ